MSDGSEESITRNAGLDPTALKQSSRLSSVGSHLGMRCTLLSTTQCP